MTAYYDTDERHSDSTRLIVPRLISAVFGVGLVIALHFLVPGLQLFELGLLLVVILFLILGYSQDIVGGIRTMITLYIATGVTASLYRSVAPYVGALWSDLSNPRGLFGSDSDVLESLTTNSTVSASTFLILMLLTWVILEVIGRLSFRDVGLPVLALIDKIGGIVIFLILGILVASLLFNVFGYGRRTRRAHNASLLRPAFNTVFRLHYATQSFWFGRNPPPIYTYDLR